jgi:hypothetical protein
MERIKIREAEVALPTADEWREAAASGYLTDAPLVSPDRILSWLDRYGHLPEAVLGARLEQGKWWSVPLLHLQSAYYPVHFENVICNHCKRRCGLSACPDTTSISWPGGAYAEIWSLFKDLPVLPCPHCHHLLSHRQTFWFAPNERDA